jgi:hypothetical protein
MWKLAIVVRCQIIQVAPPPGQSAELRLVTGLGLFVRVFQRPMSRVDTRDTIQRNIRDNYDIPGPYLQDPWKTLVHDCLLWTEPRSIAAPRRRPLLNPRLPPSHLPYPHISHDDRKTDKPTGAVPTEECHELQSRRRGVGGQDVESGKSARSGPGVE